ncbi:hypothetical protein F4818DRAFT_409834 [Hypoxylon cercidicola]|nr:hypothetical protein F4818DRAFT_409834 [Hypoxylon cercidicola]
MEPNSKEAQPPFTVVKDDKEPDKLLEPATLMLNGHSVVSGATVETPLYETNSIVTSIPQKGTSVAFGRVEHELSPKVEDAASAKLQNQQLFYLAHPADAQFQTDTPAYYLTSVSPEMPGNISLEASVSRFQKPQFKALLSSGKTWSDSPLFDTNPKLLFEVKPKWMSARYTWTDFSGKQVAYEDRKDDQHRLVITASMTRQMRDTLVALWCLRLWHDTAESSQAKRDSMERMTDPESLRGYRGSQLAKRVGAASSLAGAGA